MLPAATVSVSFRNNVTVPALPLDMVAPHALPVPVPGVGASVCWLEFMSTSTSWWLRAGSTNALELNATSMEPLAGISEEVVKRMVWLAAAPIADVLMVSLRLVKVAAWAVCRVYATARMVSAPTKRAPWVNFE